MKLVVKMGTINGVEEITFSDPSPSDDLAFRFAGELLVIQVKNDKELTTYWYPIGSIVSVAFTDTIANIEEPSSNPAISENLLNKLWGEEERNV
jgi:hypothetical protein